ncbi:hypothetical protein [Yoonia sp. TsM2_T14_4]|uniref:hypothetical protein n=1 Tax=Yoonia sp. TsM2_T14_4 TaxID=3415141 RepID=UPI003C769D1F
MPGNLVELETDALNLRATLQELATAIEAVQGNSSEAQVKVREAILLAGELADGLADAQEACG